MASPVPKEVKPPTPLMSPTTPVTSPMSSPYKSPVYSPSDAKMPRNLHFCLLKIYCNRVDRITTSSGPKIYHRICIYALYG